VWVAVGGLHSAQIPIVVPGNMKKITICSSPGSVINNTAELMTLEKQVRGIKYHPGAVDGVIGTTENVYRALRYILSGDSYIHQTDHTISCPRLPDDWVMGAEITLRDKTGKRIGLFNYDGHYTNRPRWNFYDDRYFEPPEYDIDRQTIRLKWTREDKLIQED
jgi:hypothetical protein